MLGFWYNYIGYINLATTILVPLGVLLHYARAADRHPPVARGLTPDAAAFWQRSASRVVGRGRWATGCALALAVPFIYMQNAIYVAESKWVTYLGPLVAVTVLIVVFLWRPVPRRPMGTTTDQHDHGQQIDLNQRTVWTFGRRWWFVCTISALTILVLSVIAAGLASSPDANGDFTQLTFAFGAGQAFTDFLGWYYGIPIIAAATTLALATLIALWLIARPPLATTAGERALDVWLRNRGTRVVLSLSCGALILTLAYVCSDIGNSAQLAIQDGPTGIKVGTSIAALSVPLSVAGHLLKGLAYALILLPLLSKTPRLTCAAPVETVPAGNRTPNAALPETAGPTADMDLTASERH
ncbi:hypothetical protein GCM10022381_08800 [Leifsonia kafniensis]|uniref:Uncharacterized protein n=1 Tax=Leifsonia kafniensis TaxID=475957 RepID=A0ABP7K6S0_9MICO